MCSPSRRAFYSCWEAKGTAFSIDNRAGAGSGQRGSNMWSAGPQSDAEGADCTHPTEHLVMLQRDGGQHRLV
jgi:hypothetical protein